MKLYDVELTHTRIRNGRAAGVTQARRTIEASNPHYALRQAATGIKLATGDRLAVLLTDGGPVPRVACLCENEKHSRARARGPRGGWHAWGAKLATVKDGRCETCRRFCREEVD